MVAGALLGRWMYMVYPECYCLISNRNDNETKVITSTTNDHSDANKENQVENRDDDETKVITSTNDHLKEDLKLN